MRIYMTIGNGITTTLDKVRNAQEAEARIARYQREDRYEIEVEKYPMPKAWNGEYPVYTYGK